jgi:hypothetical protein
MKTSNLERIYMPVTGHYQKENTTATTTTSTSVIIIIIRRRRRRRRTDIRVSANRPDILLYNKKK